MNLIYYIIIYNRCSILFQVAAGPLASRPKLVILVFQISEVQVIYITDNRRYWRMNTAQLITYSSIYTPIFDQVEQVLMITVRRIQKMNYQRWCQRQ